MEENIITQTPKPNPLTTVTPLSKFLALVLFVSLPFLGFYLGMRYQSMVAVPTPNVLINTNRIKPSSSLSANLNQPQASPTPTPNDETMGWKKYDDQKHNFTFEYPQDWMYESDAEGSIGFFFAGSKPDHSFGDHGGNELMIIITSNINPLQNSPHLNNYLS